MSIDLGVDENGYSNVVTPLETGVTCALDSGMNVTVLTAGSVSTAAQNMIGSKGVKLFGPQSFDKIDMELAANSETRIDFGGETNAVTFDV